MTVYFYLHPGSNLKYAKDAIECAVKLSGCDVVVLSEGSFDGVKNVSSAKHVELVKKRYPETFRKQVSSRDVEIKKMYYMNQLCMATACEEFPSWPVLAFDWDMICTRDMTFLEHGLGSQTLWLTTSVFMVRDREPVEKYAEWCGNQDTFVSGMTAWPIFAEEVLKGNYGRLDQNSIPYIDHNLHTHTDVWQDDPSLVAEGLNSKLVLWRDNKPFFRRRDGKWEYPAYILHCWGCWKTRIPEIRNTLLTP